MSFPLGCSDSQCDNCDGDSNNDNVNDNGGCSECDHGFYIRLNNNNEFVSCDGNYCSPQLRKVMFSEASVSNSVHRG